MFYYSTLSVGRDLLANYLSLFIAAQQLTIIWWNHAVSQWQLVDTKPLNVLFASSDAAASVFFFVFKPEEEQAKRNVLFLPNLALGPLTEERKGERERERLILPMVPAERQRLAILRRKPD